MRPHARQWCCPPAHLQEKTILGPADPSFRALSGRLKLTVRRYKFNKDSLPFEQRRIASRRAAALSPDGNAILSPDGNAFLSPDENAISPDGNAIAPDGMRVVSETQIRDAPAGEGAWGSGSGQEDFGSGGFGSGEVEFDGGLGEEGYAMCCGTDPALALWRPTHGAVVEGGTPAVFEGARPSQEGTFFA